MTDQLPGVLAEIAGVAGINAAIAIATHAGGTRAYIPARVGDRHWLVKAVGRDAADKLCAHFSIDHRRGQRIDVPLFGGTYKQLQRLIAARLDKLEAEGASSQTIARTTGITQRTVHRHRARRRRVEDGKQGRLL